MAVNNSNQIGTREPIDLDEIKSVQSTGPSSGSVEFVLSHATHGGRGISLPNSIETMETELCKKLFVGNADKEGLEDFYED